MKAEELKREISEIIWNVMKSNNVVEYNDRYLHDEIRKKIMPLINQFKKDVCKKQRKICVKAWYGKSGACEKQDIKDCLECQDTENDIENAAEPE